MQVFYAFSLHPMDTEPYFLIGCGAQTDIDDQNSLVTFFYPQIDRSVQVYIAYLEYYFVPVVFPQEATLQLAPNPAGDQEAENYNIIVDHNGQDQSVELGGRLFSLVPPADSQVLSVSGEIEAFQGLSEIILPFADFPIAKVNYQPTLNATKYTVPYTKAQLGFFKLDQTDPVNVHVDVVEETYETKINYSETVVRLPIMKPVFGQDFDDDVLFGLYINPIL